MATSVFARDAKGKPVAVATFADPRDAREFALRKYRRYGTEHFVGDSKATAAELKQAFPKPEETSPVNSAMDVRRSFAQSAANEQAITDELAGAVKPDKMAVEAANESAETANEDSESGSGSSS